MTKTLGIILLLIGATSVAFAGGGGFGPPTDVPEIDPGLAASALTLTLATGAMLFHKGRSKK